MTVFTNESGQTDVIALETPSVDYSLDPNSVSTPYGTYNALITADGYETEEIKVTASAFSQRRLLIN